MEIAFITHRKGSAMAFCLYALLCLLLFTPPVIAQEPVKVYGVKDGKMYIKLNRSITDASLDSFIVQYELYELGLKSFLRDHSRDSLEKAGWWIEVDNAKSVVINKPLKSFKDVINPADKILFTDKEREIARRFPSVSTSIKYGYNRFKNKNPFAVNGNLVTFFLRDNLDARRVMLAGSFNVWEPDALAMQRTDSGWIAVVKLTPGKYWYKFVADGHWMVDDDNMTRENDEYGNTNSVYFKTNHIFSLKGFSDTRKVILAGSFNNWRERELVMEKTTAGWQLPLYLADGTHTYRYITDGQWRTDPGNPEVLPNEFNDYNSVVRIGTPYIFKLDGHSNAKQVILTGSFNNWRKEELIMKRTATGWELPYPLASGNYEYRFLVDGKAIADPSNKLINNNGNSFLILGPNYTFRLKGYPNAKTVFLAGDFNSWSPSTLAMLKKGDDWIFDVYLSPGKHQYKFVVDGEWITDPSNRQWEQNELGTGNSVIWMRSGREPQ
ncbi:MAG: glycogen-binding domain-containing protein [Chitinophagaceae bacterium]